MNTRAEILQALEDFEASRMGRIPAARDPHRTETATPTSAEAPTAPAGPTRWRSAAYASVKMAIRCGAWVPPDTIPARWETTDDRSL